MLGTFLCVHEVVAEIVATGVRRTVRLSRAAIVRTPLISIPR